MDCTIGLAVKVIAFLKPLRRGAVGSSPTLDIFLFDPQSEIAYIHRWHSNEKKG